MIKGLNDWRNFRLLYVFVKFTLLSPSFSLLNTDTTVYWVFEEFNENKSETIPRVYLWGCGQNLL